MTGSQQKGPPSLTAPSSHNDKRVHHQVGFTAEVYSFSQVLTAKRSGWSYALPMNKSTPYLVESNAMQTLPQLSIKDLLLTQSYQLMDHNYLQAWAANNAHAFMQQRTLHTCNLRTCDLSTCNTIHATPAHATSLHATSMQPQHTYTCNRYSCLAQAESSKEPSPFASL